MERWTKECGIRVHNAARVAYSCGRLGPRASYKYPPAIALLSHQPFHPSNLHTLVTHITTTTQLDIALRWSYTTYVRPSTPRAVPLLMLSSCSPTRVCGTTAVQRTSEHRHYLSATEAPGLLTPQGRVKPRARSARARAGQARSRRRRADT